MYLTNILAAAAVDCANSAGFRCGMERQGGSKIRLDAYMPHPSRTLSWQDNVQQYHELSNTRANSTISISLIAQLLAVNIYPMDLDPATGKASQQHGHMLLFYVRAKEI